MNDLAAWIAPPVVGAIIGYVTNDIAIKMLFRPLKEKRLFGIRIPFTPGILPRQRHQLADNIGRMVAKELITEEIIRERVRRNDFKLSVQTTVSEYSGKLLAVPIAKLALEIPAVTVQGEIERFGTSQLARLLGGFAERFVESPAFMEVLEPLVSSAVAKIGEKSIADLIGGDRSELIRTIGLRLSGMLGEAISRPDSVESFTESASRFAEALVAEGKSLGSVLPPGAAEGISRAAEAAYPVLIDAALRYLAQRDVRAELESHGRVFLRDAIQRLNIFQRFFLSAAQYDRTLHEQMPEIVDDLIAHLAQAARSQKSRARFAGAIHDAADRFLSSSIADASASMGTDPSTLARRIVLGLVHVLSSEESKAALSGAVSNMVSSLIDEPLAAVVEKRIGIDVSSLIRTLTTALKNLAASDPGPAVARAVDAFLAGRGDRSLSDLIGLTDAGKEKLDRFLTDRVISLIDERLSAALRTLDVRTLVSERIDSLDMEAVESIVLDILANQLRWINVFGAILGAVIGLFQAALSIYLR